MAHAASSAYVTNSLTNGVGGVSQYTIAAERHLVGQDPPMTLFASGLTANAFAFPTYTVARDGTVTVVFVFPRNGKVQFGETAPTGFGHGVIARVLVTPGHGRTTFSATRTTTRTSSVCVTPGKGHARSTVTVVVHTRRVVDPLWLQPRGWPSWAQTHLVSADARVLQARFDLHAPGKDPLSGL